MSVLSFDRGRLRDEVRQTLSDPWRACEVLNLLEGHKREQAGVLIRCPAHAEKVPSCSVTQGPDGTVRVRCFACNFAGDLFSLVAVVYQLDARRDFPTVLERAAELAGINAADYEQARRMPIKTQPTAVAEDLALTWDFMPPLGADAWEYLKSRGLEEAADLCRGVGGEERADQFSRAGYAIALPLFDADGRIVAIQVRSLAAKAVDGADQRFRSIGQTSAGVFGDPLALRAAKNLIVAEGMTDFLTASLAARSGKATAAVGIAGVKATAGLLTLPLRGKRVLIATDADTAGDAAAAHLGEQLLRLGAIPIRARPTPNGADLTAMRAAGVDLVAFFRAALLGATGFRTAAQQLQGERAERLANAPKLLSFAVHFLDTALGGIAPGDIVLLGGTTSAGKTEMARLIATANAQAGKRVNYFALEAAKREIERRAKYALLVQRILSEFGAGHHYERMNFLDWNDGKIDDVTGPYEDEADRAVEVQCQNLLTHYPEDDFTVEDFEREVLAAADETDLFILDHFHFIDFGEDENRAAKNAIKRIRKLAERIQKPVLIVAHVRKAQRTGTHRLIPVLDDFHGSSDVVKMATKAVLIAPATDRENRAPHLWATYLSVAKCRVEGARARFAACVDFDARRRVYERDFLLGTVTPGGDKFCEVDPAKWPQWAKAGKREREQNNWQDGKE